MIRGFLVALTIWAAYCGDGDAQIQPCIPDPASWSTPYQQGSIQSTTYYNQKLVLTVLFRTGINLVYANEPLPTAQGLTSIQNADSYYTTRISGRYPQALLEEQYGCPLLNEDGPFLLEG